MIKQFLLLSLILVAGLFSCRHAIPAATIAEAPDYHKAESFLNLHDDSAFFYFNKVATGSKDSLQKAMAYNRMALIQEDAGDDFGAQESLSLSLGNNPKNRLCSASDFNELGLTSLNLKTYTAAAGYFEQAIRYVDNKEFRVVLLNNMALALEKNAAYTRALKIYHDIIKQTAKEGTYARILSNMARTEWLSHSNYNAAPLLLKALKIREKIKDDWGLNASYSHLADYYTLTHPDSALYYASNMYATARKLNSPDDQLEALQKLAKLSPPATAKSYFGRYITLNDSLQAARNVAKNQFALIRYDAEKNKADYLRSQKDNAEKQYQIARQNVLLAGAIFGSIAVILLLSYGYRRRKRMDRLRLSNKVHSRLANGLYQLVQEVDNDPSVDKPYIARQLNTLYERSRTISHESFDPPEADFSGEVSRLLMAFAGSGTNVAVIGNDADCWENITPQIKFELEQVLQEWMVNMRKHSQATNVGVKFGRSERQLDIYYTDNGTGFPANLKYGRGLQDTENRIKALDGQLIFETKPEKGLKIHLVMPLK